MTVEEPLDIVLDQPWEAEQVQFSPAVYDESTGRFRLYYSAWIDGEQLICALDSDDGLSWERPSLGLVEWGDRRVTTSPTVPVGDS